MGEFLENPPSELWKLLELAREDLLTVEKDRRFEVDMYSWFTVRDVKKRHCSVCLAGAFLRGRRRISFELMEKALTDQDPGGFSLKDLVVGRITSYETLNDTQLRWEVACLVLNLFRIGSFIEAVHTYYNSTGKSAPAEAWSALQASGLRWVPYEKDRDLFLTYLSKLIEVFKEYEV